MSSNVSQSNDKEKVPPCAIAIVGIGCRYPGASNPKELWENVVGRRQQFRKFLDQRLPISEYCDKDPLVKDKIYATQASYIDGFTFDWANWRIPKQSFESTDIAQWLALDVAKNAVEDAGYSRISAPKDRTGVVVGNSLTGEHSRASGLRLRWPYVRRALNAAMDINGFHGVMRDKFSDAMEHLYKSSFAEVNEDTLAGGLSNTIAGRICNYFDFNGGGYVVDGACSSSLLSICTAADHLVNNDWDMALAGGVDISLDPFELVGFAKATALTADAMRVYDKMANGFLPGEGCGFVVLKRLADAIEENDTVYAVLRGWGVSSDGKGGITAPNYIGQSQALTRAYQRAGYSPHEIDFIEGHGTGTRVGDRVELLGITAAMSNFGDPISKSCGVTSFKSIVGHTKAAAGIGAFIKTVMAVNRRIAPPTAGCSEPNPIFDDESRCLYPIRNGRVGSSDKIMRAGVSAMGFGGINSHVTVTSPDKQTLKWSPEIEERALLVNNQDSEAFAFGAATTAELQKLLILLAGEVGKLSIAELTDAAAFFSSSIPPDSKVRAAFLASTPSEAEECINWLIRSLDNKAVLAENDQVSFLGKAWLGMPKTAPRIGFLLPGQGSQHLHMGRLLVERYPWARNIVERFDDCVADILGKPISSIFLDNTDRDSREEIKQREKMLAQTEITQPAICLVSLLYARFLERMGIKPSLIGGHSLGELTAFHLAGVYDEEALFRFAALRGLEMSKSATDRIGAMASISCTESQALALLKDSIGYAIVANINSPRQIVVSGEEDAVMSVIMSAQHEGFEARKLRVSGAFHSRLMQNAAENLRSQSQFPIMSDSLSAALFSSVSGEEVIKAIDLKEHFSSQIVAPVQFMKLVQKMDSGSDLLIEVGPGRVLSGLTGAIIDVDSRGQNSCVSIASRPDSSKDLNTVLARAFIQGADINWEALYENRLVRPYVSPSARVFIENPCEKPFDLAVTNDQVSSISSDFYKLGLGVKEPALSEVQANQQEAYGYTLEAKQESISSQSVMDGVEKSDGEAEGLRLDGVNTVLRDLVMKRTGFAAETISADLRLLDDLNLDSIKAGELVASVAKQMGIAGAIEPSKFANASLREIAEAVYGKLGSSSGGHGQHIPTVPPAPKVAVATPSEAVAKNGMEAHGILELPAMGMTRDVEVLLRDLVAKRTGFAAETISADLRLLDDLNLDSIKAGELVASVAKQMGIAGAIEPSKFANASLREIAEAVYGKLGSSSGGHGQHIPTVPPAPKVATATPSETVARTETVPQVTEETNAISPLWVRNYTIKYIADPVPENTHGKANWDGQKVLVIYQETSAEIVIEIKQRLESRNAVVDTIVYGDARLLERSNVGHYAHVVTVLPNSGMAVDEAGAMRKMVERLHATVNAALGSKACNIAFIQFGGGFFGSDATDISIETCGVSSFARSVHLDHPEWRIRVIDLSPLISYSLTADLVTQEITAGEELFQAVGYDSVLQRRIPRLELQEPVTYKKRDIHWNVDDVVIITGGAKGITAECAFALAGKTKAKFVLVGSTPLGNVSDGNNREIHDTLGRFKGAGLTCHYYSCDLSDKNKVSDLIARVRLDIGPIRAVVHGAARNYPSRAENRSIMEVVEEIAPKVIGAVNLLNALADTPPKLIVGLTSIIGVTGMPGNSWYALSNELLDHILRRFSSKYPESHVVSIAYSVWGETGMGVRLGAVDHLSRAGVGAIPTDEGVRRFMELLEHELPDKQVIVTAAVYGLPTWVQLVGPIKSTEGYRFIEHLNIVQPGVELVAQTQLNVNRDLYLYDHNYRGSLLLPTVFGIEAMAQAAKYLLGANAEFIVALEDINLVRPIVVDAETGVQIQIHAAVDEQQSGANRRVRAHIRVEQTGFKIDHFSATFIFGQFNMPEKYLHLPIENRLWIDPKKDLYGGGLLFQGPLFQRITGVFQLDRKNTVTTATDKAYPIESPLEGFGLGHSGGFVLGDPYLRDAMLQSVQLPLSPDIMLPIKIGRIERHVPWNETAGICLIKVEIKEVDGNEYMADIVTTNSYGLVLERLEDCRVRVVESHPEGFTPDRLVDMENYDRKRLSSIVDAEFQVLELYGPSLTLEYMPRLQEMSKQERRKCEIDLVHRCWADYKKELSSMALPQNESLPQIEWLPSGKPIFLGSEWKGIDLSISHDREYCISTVGKGPQGCDIEAVEPREEEDCIALLGVAYEKLLRSAAAEIGEPIDYTAIRLWAVLESVRKAYGFLGDVRLSLQKVRGEVVVFNAQLNNDEFPVLTFPMAFFRPPIRIVALVAAYRFPKPMAVEYSGEGDTKNLTQLPTNVDASRFVETPEKLREYFEYRFQPSFSDCGNLGRSISSSRYMLSVGKVREITMAEIGRQLTDQIVTGEWGLVTNWAALRVTGLAGTYDRLIAQLRVVDVKGSTISLRCDIFRLDEYDNKQLVAEVTQETTWVRIIGHGQVSPAPIPDYFLNFLRKFQFDKDNAHIKPLDLNPPPTDFVYTSSGEIKNGLVLNSEIFYTSLEDSNLVGNVYYANYFSWQSRVMNSYLYSVAPELVKIGHHAGEPLCIKSRLDYLRDAMPFDRVLVEMALKKLWDEGLLLSFSYYRVLSDDSTQKLAVGEQEIVWSKQNERGEISTMTLPKILMSSLKKKIQHLTTPFNVVNL
ncbi:MAG: SDR family NAD(P)-dependent oxidoreductase [Methylovulum sp.]|nr:SDR family NAD(P)-dependent oxidoreductase [Methylovulum sp.]